MMKNFSNQTNTMPYQPSEGTVNDTRLTKEELLLLVTLMSWPLLSEITPRKVQKHCKITPKKQAALFEGLEDAGYLTHMLLEISKNRIEHLVKVNEPSRLPLGDEPADFYSMNIR